jgi:hypothetical protein
VCGATRPIPGTSLSSSSSAPGMNTSRQHERVSLRDQHRLEEIKAMTDPSQPATVTHWLAPLLDRNAPTAPPVDAPD